MSRASASWFRAATAAHVASWRTRIWAGLLAALAIGFAFTPLLNVLAYPAAFALGLVASVASADLAAAFVRRARATERRGLDHALPPGRVVAELWARAAAINIAMLAPPLAILCLNAVRVRNCDWTFGFEAFVGLTALSSLAATSLGVGCALVAGDRRRWSNALPYLAIVAWWARAAWRVYAEPPVFSYAAFGGFFPGNLYDENIALTSAFYWSRGFQALAAATSLAVLATVVDVPSLTARWLRERRPMGRRVRPTVVAVVSASLAALVWFDAGELGFDVDAADIRTELRGRRATEHFVIYYPKGGAVERDIDIIAEDHEYRYAQALRAFDLSPGTAPITSHYFADASQKKRWFGAENVHMAKPWSRQIFLDHRSFPHSVLRHEIAHIVAGSFGDSTFGASVDTFLGLPIFPNPGLIEGAAVAADWPGHRGDLTPHQAVRAMLDLGYAPPIDRIIAGGFFAFSSARSYTTAGSFCRFLIEHHGAARFRVLYESGGDFEAAYGKSVHALAAEWHAFIETIDVPAARTKAAKERFRRKAVHQRPCPHAIARKRYRMAELVAIGEREDAISLSREVCRNDPSEPRYRLELATLLVLDRQVDEARQVYEALAADEGWSDSIRVDALIALADLAGQAGDLDGVRRHLAAAAALSVPDDTRRQIVARRLAVDHTGPAGPALRDYFWRHPIDRKLGEGVTTARAAAAVAAEPNNALALYLLGLRLYVGDAWAEATDYFERAAAAGLPDPLLVKRNATLMAVAAYRAGDYDAVLAAADILDDPANTEMVRWEARDWRERVHWKRTGELP